MGTGSSRGRARWLGVAACLVLVLAATLVAGRASAATPSGPLLPSADPFYTYDGPLAGIAPGTVLRTRQITLIDGETNTPLPYPTYQLLYRTTGELGQPTVTVTTVIEPLTEAVTGPKIVSYQTFYDALGPICDPSYTLAGGNASYGADDQAFMLPYLNAGDTIVVSDYEGEHLDWVAGQESGYDTLDGIRAAESYLGAPEASTPVAMLGYSGGAIATEFAAELAPKYAPSLDIVGDAEGGVLADIEHNTFYVNGSQDWSGTIPAVLVSLGRAFGINITPYESAYGAQVANTVSDECINSFLGNYPGLTIAKLVKPQYANLYQDIPAISKIGNTLIMGTDGTPKGPILMGNGNQDGTGDGVMIAGDVEGLAHEFCQRGVSVQYTEYQGLSHTDAAVPFEASAIPWIAERLGGQAVTNGCSSIGSGNALTPDAVPVLDLHLHVVGAKPRRRGIEITLAPNLPEPQLTVVLRRGRRTVSRLTLSQTLARGYELILRSRGRMPAPGRYTVTVSSTSDGSARATVRLTRRPTRRRTHRRR